MKKLLLFAAVTAFCLPSCQKDDGHETTGSPMDPHDVELIAQMGYDTGDLVRIEEGYLVEGDILLSEDYLEAVRQDIPDVGTRQAWFPSRGIIAEPYRTITVGIGSDLPGEEWKTIIPAALKRWNDVTDCDIELRFVSFGTPDLSIQGWFANNQNQLCVARPPLNGRIGGPISINHRWTGFDRLGNAGRETLVTHLVGHSIGLAHTQLTYPPSSAGLDDDVNIKEEHIPGTPDTDSQSVMYKHSYLTKANANLSEDDRQALRILYKPSVVPLDAGSITSSLKINSGSQTSFTISSTRDASGGDGKITYSWEIDAGTGWVDINNSGNSLTTFPAQVATARYRRTAHSAGESKVSNICTVTDEYYTTCHGGKIEDEKTTAGGNITIGSLADAHCKTQSGITYSWEADTGGGWVSIPGDGKTLTAAAPEVFSSKFRRLATCEHGTQASNTCLVINTTCVEKMGGRIPDVKPVNYERWFLLDFIESLEPAAGELGQVTYRWEILKNGTWQTQLQNELDYEIRVPFEFGKTAYVRRAAISQYGTSYSNECLVMDMFYPNYGGWDIPTGSRSHWAALRPIFP